VKATNCFLLSLDCVATITIKIANIRLKSTFYYLLIASWRGVDRGSDWYRFAFYYLLIASLKAGPSSLVKPNAFFLLSLDCVYSTHVSLYSTYTIGNFLLSLDCVDGDAAGLAGVIVKLSIISWLRLTLTCSL